MPDVATWSAGSGVNARGAVAVEVVYADQDGQDRCIEVQLRTQVMHEWAITVERLSGRLGQNLKSDGQHAVQQLMAVISQAMALEEKGMAVDASPVARHRALASPGGAVPVGRSTGVNTIQHFLLVFDHGRGRLVQERHFEHDGTAALAAYAEKEREHAGDRSIEIVLIGLDSIETVRLTHANYYDGSVAVSKYLVGI